MQTDFEQLYKEMTELFKNKNIKVITPHQLESPYNYRECRESNVFTNDMIIVDYITKIGTKK